MNFMKILILANNDVGLYKFRKELLEALLIEHQVYISLPNGSYVDDMIQMGCIYEQCEFERHGTNPFAEIKQIKIYQKLMKQVEPDVVLSYTIKPNIYGGIAAAKYNIPYIANITGLGTAVENKGILQKISILLYKYAFKKISCVFVQNAENKQFFIDNNISKDKLKLIPGSGVNLDQFSVLEYPKGKVEFVFISRIMKTKGIEHYLEAAEHFHNRDSEIKFHICGFCEEKYEDRLKDLSDRGIIIYHGRVDDIRDVLKDVSATIHPTYYPEGLSNVLLESAACGRPIITTDRSGCREVIDDGVNGYVIKQKDTQSLIDGIEKFLKLSYEDRVSMGLEGRKKVAQEFDRKIVVNSYMVQLKLLNNRR